MEVLPGFTVHGMDIGKWLARQRTPKVWAALAQGQRERLEQLGIQAPVQELEAAPSKAPTTRLSAFEKGAAALAQYRARTGTVAVPRGHVERLEDGTEVRLGVWRSNMRSRRDSLPAPRRQLLADLGLFD